MSTRIVETISGWRFEAWSKDTAVCVRDNHEIRPGSWRLHFLRTARMTLIQVSSDKCTWSQSVIIRRSSYSPFNHSDRILICISLIANLCMVSAWSPGSCLRTDSYETYNRTDVYITELAAVHWEFSFNFSIQKTKGPHSSFMLSHIRVCLYVYMVCLSVRLYTCLHMCTRIHTHIHMYVYTPPSAVYRICIFLYLYTLLTHTYIHTCRRGNCECMYVDLSLYLIVSVSLRIQIYVQTNVNMCACMCNN